MSIGDAGFAPAAGRRFGSAEAPSPSKSASWLVARAPSMASMRSFVATPPLAEKPPGVPPAASTRWHGTTTAKGFRPRACPTARARLLSPRRAATSPYDKVAPAGMPRATS
jgi:hypothetical protein